MCCPLAQPNRPQNPEATPGDMLRSCDFCGVHEQMLDLKRSKSPEEELDLHSPSVLCMCLWIGTPNGDVGVPLVSRGSPSKKRHPCGFDSLCLPLTTSERLLPCASIGTTTQPPSPPKKGSLAIHILWEPKVVSEGKPQQEELPKASWLLISIVGLSLSFLSGGWKLVRPRGRAKVTGVAVRTFLSFGGHSFLTVLVA